MKDYFFYQGTVSITGSRDAIREAFLRELIVDGEAWMKMVADRNKTAHTYNEDVAKEVEHNILNVYYMLFVEFQMVMEQKCFFYSQLDNASLLEHIERVGEPIFIQVK